MHPRFHALDNPDKPCAIHADTGEHLAYGALETWANQGAHLFRSLGLGTGDTLALWAPNTLRYFEIYWAAQRAGLYITPISTRLGADEAAYILNDCSAKLLIGDASVTAMSALLDIRSTHCPSLEHVLFADTAFGLGCKWHDAITSFSPHPISDESAGFHMVYSSGTTGRPKGVRLPLTGGPATEPHMLAARQQMRYGVGKDTVFLSPAPLYHTAPLAFSTSVQRLGGTVIIPDKFTPEGTLQAIAQHRVTFAQMVPTMFIRLLQLPQAQRKEFDTASLTHIVHAAAPCPVEIKRAMIDWLGPIIYEYYGGSEGNGSTFITPQEWLEKPGSVGRADWGVVHVADESGNVLACGEQGLIYFEGGWDFAYLNDPEKTASARHPVHPGWTTLGDIGYLDSDGYLFLTDRRSFMIISGGVNIYPQEAENILAAHPKVADVAVIGVPDADMGEAVKAVVQPRNWQEAGDALANELIAFCRSRLADYKCPRSIDFEASLPRHETGKLYKRELRDRYWPDSRASCSVPA
ncbi:MAG: acyl-CoA synthetase [Blastomonas sp.]|nr:acyl-CoA synthetase [Blastomonas sp.]MDM7956646.1 acyl-CoA synthetase [Blastomonas sp.]